MSVTLDLFGYVHIKQPPLRYLGSKFRLAPWIIQKMPLHKCYVEPYGGGAGVLLQKPRSYAEVYNDLDGSVVNFFRVLRDPILSQELLRLAELTPFAREELKEAFHYENDSSIERARKFLVRSYMGYGSSSCTRMNAGFSCDSKRKNGLYSQYWGKMSDRLTPIIDRLHEVIIENKPALELMPMHDRIDTLFYCDPPYLLSTRSMSTTRSYKHELSEDDHCELIAYLHSTKGHVILSGYDSDLYNDLLSPNDWQKQTTSSRIAANRGTTTKMEVLWVRR